MINYCCRRIIMHVFLGLCAAHPLYLVAQQKSKQQTPKQAVIQGKPVLPKAPRPTAQVAKVRALGRKAVIGKNVSKQESDAFAKAEAENLKELSDALLEKESPTEDIEVSPSFSKQVAERFAGLREKLSDATESIASKQNLVKTVNRELTQERKFGFEFPVLGKGFFELEPDMYSEAIKMHIRFEKDGKTKLEIKPVILDSMKLEMVAGKLKNSQLHNNPVKIFGEDATIDLKSIDLGSGNILNKIVFRVTFKKPLKKKLPFINEDLIISKGFLTLTAWGSYPVTLTAITTFRGQKVRILLLYSPQSKLTAAIRVKNMELKNLIPQVAGTPLEKMKITQGTVYADLWVPGPTVYDGEMHIPEDDPAREIRIEAELEKMPEISVDEYIEDVDPEVLSEETSLDITDDITTDLTADAAKPVVPFPADSDSAVPETMVTSTSLDKAAESLISDVPEAEDAVEPEPAEYTPTESYDDSAFADTAPSEEFSAPDLVYPSDTEINPEIIAEETPDLATTEDKGPISLEEELAEEAAAEGQPCDLLNDPCCREKDESGKIELDTSFSLDCRISRYYTEINVGANDFIIPHVGPVASATLTLYLQRSGVAREDVGLRTNLKKKTLKRTDSSLRLDLSCVPIRDIGVLENGMIQIQLNPAQKEKDGRELYTVVRGRLELNGRMRLQCGSLGRLPIDVLATITRKGLIFTGKLDFCEKYAELEESESGHIETEQRCLKNNLTYGGLTLENVRVIYGYPPYTAEELHQRETQRAMRQEIRSMATDRRNAIRQARDDRRNGVTSDSSVTKLAASKSISTTVIRKADTRKQLSIIATAKLWGLRLIATIGLQPDAKNAHKRKLSFNARGVLKDFQPFKYVPGAKNIPGLRDIKFGEISVELGINNSRGRPRPTVKLGGAVTLFGMLLRANCKFVVNKKGQPGVFIYTLPQPQQSLTDIIPVLQNDFFRNITCCNSKFALTTVAEIDTSSFTPDEEIELSGFNLSTIRKGVAFEANVPFTGTLDPVGKWLGLNKPPTASEKKRMDEEAQEREGARKRGEKLPPLNFCSGTQNMFRILANINLANPSFSEFRIGVTRRKLRQFSATSNYAQPKQSTTGRPTTSKYSYATTRFSDESLQPMIKSTDQSVINLQAQQKMEKEKQDREARKTSAAEKPAQPVIELDQVEIFFLGDVTRPSMGVAVGLLVRPTPEELLRLKGSVELSPKDVTIGAQMLGTWHNAFTLQGWELSNVAFLIGFLYGVPMPVRLGGAASLKVRKDFDIGFKFLADADITGMGFEGNISRVITILDLINIFLKATKFPLPPAVQNMPMPLEITNAYVKYAPKDLRIGEQILERGFAIKADVNILGKPGKIDVAIDDGGLKGMGTLEKINWENILKVTSADGKGDPRIDMEISFDRQNFLITGLINIANIIEQSTFIEISASGFKLDCIGAIGKAAWHGKPLLMAQIKAETSGPLTNPQFILMIDLQQYFMQFIKEQANEQLAKASQAVEAELNHAQQEIDKINSVIATADNKIKDAERQVNGARDALKKIQEARTSVSQTFENAQRNVNTLKDKIKELDQWYQSLPTI